MFSFDQISPPSSLLSTLAFMAAFIMLFHSMVTQLVPQLVRNYLITLVQYLFKPYMLTFVFDMGDEFNGGNQVYEAAGVYLATLRSPKTKRLNVGKSDKEQGLVIRLEDNENVNDMYDGIELHWRFVHSKPENKSLGNMYPIHSFNNRIYELSFHSEHEYKVSNSYIPYILKRAKAITDKNRVIKMYTLGDSDSSRKWESINFEHPATFETLAMDEDKKNAIIEDLNRFVKSKEFYKKVGRAWKRGYLLYGPPGTGKSSLVAAIANHLKFDIYDLQLSNIYEDSKLRRLLLSTTNKSILVIEDIDRSVELSHRRVKKKSDHQNDNHIAPIPYIRRRSLTLSGLLNFIDGLWSSCGDERIIIFTTNHKDKLDTALLRPGRMDKHIYMGYCTYEAFKQLASSYLGITGADHQLYGKIKGLLDDQAKVTPAQVAEEFLKYENVDFSLEEFLKLLEGKKMEKADVDHVDHIHHRHDDDDYEHEDYDDEDR